MTAIDRSDNSSIYRRNALKVQDARQMAAWTRKKKNEYMNLFVCFNCKGSLFTRRFVKMDSKPWCVLCYNDHFTATCIRCEEKIDVDDEDIEYHGDHWHGKCFYCSNDCGETDLFQKTFGFEDGHIYCNNCFSERSKILCEECNKPIKGGSKTVVFKGRHLHMECFLCYNCKHPVEGSGHDSQFKGTDHKTHDGEIYCNPCYADLFAKKCDACDLPIMVEEEARLHMGAPYHKECLVCITCGCNLSDVRYFVYEGEKYCMDCFEEPQVFGKVCVGCDQKITGVCDTAFFIVEDSYWHAGCFKCIRCSDNLDPEQPFVCPSESQGRQSDIYCERCGIEMLTAMETLVGTKFKVEKN